jgi:hypothetical protein
MIILADNENKQKIEELQIKIYNECNVLHSDTSKLKEFDKLKKDMGMVPKDVIPILNERKELMKLYSIKETTHLIKEKYKYSFDLSFLDFIMFNNYIHFIFLKIDIPKSYLDYYKNNLSFFERSYIRIKCLKLGYRPSTIENIINTHYKMGLIVEYQQNICYFRLSYYLSLYEPIILKKGRPALPADIKDILKTYINKKSTDKVKVHTKIVKTLQSLFSPIELIEIKKIIEESEKEDEIKQHYIKKFITLQEITTSVDKK